MQLGGSLFTFKQLLNGSPDWVNAIAASRTTLKVERFFLLLVIVPTAKNPS
ncbi:hypothetical protein [Nostoc sp.]|uniref:hypothetical protein n=1 Tax=Nostoc sp. TaxID=1180 RepID=UPI002FF555ED